MAPPYGTKLQNVRVEPDLWAEFGELAEPDRSAVLRAFIEWYVRKSGAKMPKRPSV